MKIVSLMAGALVLEVVLAGGCARYGFDEGNRDSGSEGRPRGDTASDGGPSRFLVELHGGENTERDREDAAVGDAMRSDMLGAMESDAFFGSDAAMARDVGDADALDSGTADTGPAADAAVLTAVIPVIEDSTVRDGAPDTNGFSNGTELGLGYCANAQVHNMRSWLKFELTSIPRGATIVSAAVELYFFIHWGSQNYLMHYAPSDAWVEGTITWNNQPAFDGLVLDRAAAFSEDNVWKRFDVSSVVAQELESDQALTVVFEGETLLDPATSPPDVENYARAREFGDPAFRPRLVIQYMNN